MRAQRLGLGTAVAVALAVTGFLIGVSIAAATVGRDDDSRRSVADMSTSERAKVMNIKTLPNGQTMGRMPVEDVYYTEDDLPDFIGAYSDDGKHGYLRKEDYIGPPPPSSPAEARAVPETTVVPLFADDGKTVIGRFTFGGGGVTVVEGHDEVPIPEDEPFE